MPRFMHVCVICNTKYNVIKLSVNQSSLVKYYYLLFFDKLNNIFPCFNLGDVVFSPPGNLAFNREGTSLNMTAIYHKTIRENQNYVIHFQPVNNRTSIQFYPTNTVNLADTDVKQK